MSAPRRLAFSRIADATLSHADVLVRRWLSAAGARAAEWVCKNPTRADHRRGSFKVNLATGKWSDFATGDKAATSSRSRPISSISIRPRRHERSPRRSESIPMNDDPFAPVGALPAHAASTT